MRRADRLFEIVQRLRGGRLVTAKQLAERLELSERTIYRDIRDLQAAGVPIEGAAGVGYVLRGGFDIPPLMFTRGEIEALVLGARLVQAWGGQLLAAGATEALAKIEAVVPERLRGQIATTPLYAPEFAMQEEHRHRVDALNRAAQERRIVAFAYRRQDRAQSRRRVWPLGLHFWSGVWTLAAWCELRSDFRTFRLDRMGGLKILDTHFRPEPGRTLADYLKLAARDLES